MNQLLSENVSPAEGKDINACYMTEYCKYFIILSSNCNNFPVKVESIHLHRASSVCQDEKNVFRGGLKKSE